MEIINQLFDEKHWSLALIAAIEDVYEHLYIHREANFLGAMLQHHTLMSSKYLSKWIEAKNK